MDYKQKKHGYKSLYTLRSFISNGTHHGYFIIIKHLSFIAPGQTHSYLAPKQFDQKLGADTRADVPRSPDRIGQNPNSAINHESIFFINTLAKTHSLD